MQAFCQKQKGGNLVWGECAPEHENWHNKPRPAGAKRKPVTRNLLPFGGKIRRKSPGGRDCIAAFLPSYRSAFYDERLPYVFFNVHKAIRAYKMPKSS